MVGHRRSARTLALAVAAAGLIGAGCAPTSGVGPTGPLAFTRHAAPYTAGAAFVSAGDVFPGSGKELAVAAFGAVAGGPGTVDILQRGANFDTWTRTPVVTAAQGVKFPNEPTLADLNGDGRTDVIVPGGFFICNQSNMPCGTLAWYEQNADRTFTRHDILTPGQERFFHRALLTDVDGDGVSDLVTVGETFNDSLTMWFKGDADPANPRFDPAFRMIGPGGGALPTLADVDGDGDTDIASGSLFGGKWFMWYERTGAPTPATPAGSWAFHVMSTYVGPGFELERVPNLYGDGVARWVGTNHVNTRVGDPTLTSGVYQLTPIGDPRGGWNTKLLSSGIDSRALIGQGAPSGLGAGDIDGDGRIDLAVAGDGDDRVFWLKQNPDHTFTTYMIDSQMGQSGGALVVDLDENGSLELVFTSYELNTVRVYTH